MEKAGKPLASEPRTTTEIIAGTAFFGGLAGEHLEAIVRLCQREDYPEGYRIYNIGEPARTFYVLVDGMVRFAIGFGPRKASAGEVLRRGGVFGWAAISQGMPHRIATATCLTRSTVLAIDGMALFELMEARHSLGYHVMKQLNLLITGKLTDFAAA